MVRAKNPSESLAKGDSSSLQASSQRSIPSQSTKATETTSSRPQRKRLATEKGAAFDNPVKKQRMRKPKVYSDSDSDSTDSLDRIVGMASSGVKKKATAGRNPPSPSIPVERTPIPPTPLLPLLKGDLDKDVVPLRFKNFKERKVGGIVAVNFEALLIEPDLKLDLTPTLGHFSKWLTVNEPYSLDVVRRFYCNMAIHDTVNDDDEVIESFAMVKLRGREFRVDPHVINEVLGTDKMKFEKNTMTSARSYKILLQTDKYPGQLNFKLNEMCDYFKIIHYIYSRSMCNKSSSYQYLNKHDYLTLAAIIDQQKLDIGNMIYTEMRAFFHERTPATPLPFPQIVSLILIRNRIFHLEGKRLTLPVFSKSHISKMRIPLPFNHRTAMLPTRAKDKGKGITEEPSHSHEETEHSSAPILTPSAPPSESINLAQFQLLRQQIQEDNAHRFQNLQKNFDIQQKHYQELLFQQRETHVALRDKENLILAKQEEILTKQNDLLNQFMKYQKENEEQKKKTAELHQEVADVKNLLLAYLHNLGPSIHEDDLQEIRTSPPVQPSQSVVQPPSASTLSPRDSILELPCCGVPPL